MILSQFIILEDSLIDIREVKYIIKGKAPYGASLRFRDGTDLYFNTPVRDLLIEIKKQTQ